MEHIAEVISIDELRRRRTERETPRAAMATTFRMPLWMPVWVTWLPIWQAPAAAPQAPLRAAAWNGR